MHVTHLQGRKIRSSEHERLLKSQHIKEEDFSLGMIAILRDERVEHAPERPGQIYNKKHWRSVLEVNWSFLLRDHSFTTTIYVSNEKFSGTNSKHACHMSFSFRFMCQCPCPRRESNVFSLPHKWSKINSLPKQSPDQIGKSAPTQPMLFFSEPAWPR